MNSDTPATNAAPTRRSVRTGTVTTPAAAAENSIREEAASSPATPLEHPAPPMRAGLRSRVRNVPLADADTAVVVSEPSVTESESATPAPEVRPSLRRSARLSTIASVVTVAEVVDDATRSTELAPSVEVNEPASADPVTPVVEDEVVDDEVVDIEAADEPAADAREHAQQHADAEHDEFLRAARLFGATSEVATQSQTQPMVRLARRAAKSAPTSTRPAVAHDGGHRVRKVAAASFSVGAMAIAGLLAVGMTTPVEAVAAGSHDQSTAAVVAVGGAQTATVSDDVQAFVAPAAATAAELSRQEGYAAVSVAQMAVDSGIRDTSSLFVNNTSSAVQWPFPVGVPVSSGFGMRWGYMHNGVDFVPGGEGAPIRAIADGIVRIATEAGASYGVHVIIDHVVDGQAIGSHYAHMLVGSLKVKPGDVVKRGQIIGNVGNTGHSTGPHMHFEILLNGTTPTEPLAWMEAHNIASTVVTMPTSTPTEQ